MKEKVWEKIPHLADEELNKISPFEVRVLFTMYQMAQQRNWETPSNKTLALELKTSRKSISKARRNISGKIKILKSGF